MARAVIRGKKKLQSLPVKPVGFYGSQIMGISSYNACGTSVDYRNSIKCKLCLTNVHVKWNCLNYVDSQYIKFSNKHGIATATVKIWSHLQLEISLSCIPCLHADSIVIVIQMNHA